MEQEIIVNDMSLALLLRDTLEKSGNRNPKYKQLDYKRFTPEELDTITSLKLEELSELVLYSNSISHSFELPNMMKNGMLNDIKLDFDLYPILKQQYPNLDEALFEQQRYGVACKWQENLSNIRTTKYKKRSIVNDSTISFELLV